MAKFIQMTSNIGISMAHFRERFASLPIKKLAKLWPAVGLVGLRQSGKTTLMSSLFSKAKLISFDEFELRNEASRSPTQFLEKLNTPIILDEIQKVPELFDAIKLKVDQNRIPGSYYLTGSAAFSAKTGIRESLTGRIGIIELLPMTLAELQQQTFKPINKWAPEHIKNLPPPRFECAALNRASLTGGMPFPAFLHDSEQRRLYWQSWLETTILRDLARYFPKGFDPDFAYLLLDKIASALRNGELPTLKHFPMPIRKVRNYLNAMENIFLLHKINCHPDGIGKEIWLLTDSGLAAHLMGQVMGEGCTLSLIRHFLWNEVLAQTSYQIKHLPKYYYKSAQGSPVDFVLDGIPFRIVPTATGITQQLGFEERALLGAMKKLASPVGYLLGPTDKLQLPTKKEGIGILPWTIWS